MPIRIESDTGSRSTRQIRSTPPRLDARREISGSRLATLFKKRVFTLQTSATGSSCHLRRDLGLAKSRTFAARSQATDIPARKIIRAPASSGALPPARR